ncbi:hypothetical protein ACJQWK_03999 [Exserohilum turcicum]
MVLSILLATVAAPGLLGSQEAIRQSQSKEKREEHRARRCNLIATCVKSSNRSREINGRQVVLRNGKLWIDTGSEDGSPLGHPYAGYYLPYPDTKYEGLVTTITDVAPIMNWIYVDKETCEVKYGVRADAQPNLTGPFDCTRQDRRLTFDGWEGWCAVEQAPGLWALYFDLDDDGLKSKLGPGTRVLEIELTRKEKRFQKEADARQQDQTTKRSVDTKEDAPVDQPLGPETLVTNPGVMDQTKSEENAAQNPRFRPMRIPKSIFENPPPMIESLVFRPASPPPAYTPAAREEPVKAEAAEPGVAESGAVKPVTAENKEPDVVPTKKQQPLEIPKPDNVQRLDPSPSRSGNIQSKPDNVDRTTPIKRDSPSPEFLLPSNEKRTPPRLNRNSGSRALAQALKFEALAAAQKPQEATRTSSRQRGSRANSNTSSTYSNEDEARLAMASIQRQPSPTPAPLALAVSKAKQARALVTRNQAPAVTKTVSDPSIQPPLVKEAVPDPSVQRPVTPPRQLEQPLPEDPAVSGPGRVPPSSQRLRISRPSPSPRASAPRPTSRSGRMSPVKSEQRERSGSIQSSFRPPSRPPSSRSTGRRSPVERERSGSIQSSSRQPPRPPSSRSSGRRSPVEREQRERSGSIQSSSSRIPSRPPSSGSGRQPLTRTMTSGRPNQGMSSRIGGGFAGRDRTAPSPGRQFGPPATGQNRSRSGTDARKTTSALFRQIDELVSLENEGSASGDAEGKDMKKS